MMNATLTERYIEATVRRLPAAAQDDVRRELDASIADAIEARTDRGEPRHDAERATLTEMGDPAALASGFADRPLHLIGPRFYLVWLRLFKVLIWSLPAVTAVAGGIGHAVVGASIGTVLAEAIVLAINVALHTAFWLTLIFVVIERSGRDAPNLWNVDMIPETTDNDTGWTDAIASLVFLLLAAIALVWDAVRGLVWNGDDWIPALSAELWPWWVTGLFVLMATEAAFVTIRAIRRRWTVAFATWRTVLAALFVSWVATVMGRGILLNPEVVALLAEQNVGDDVLAILAVVLNAGVVVLAVWSVIFAWRGARRDR